MYHDAGTIHASSLASDNGECNDYIPGLMECMASDYAESRSRT